MHAVGAVILAAGESSRFGEPKQLVQFRGRTLLSRAISAATESQCQPIVVVTGSDSATIGAAVNEAAVRVVENRQWRRGIGSSIRAGVQQMIDDAPNIDAIVLLVCDQPFVTGAVVQQLVAIWRATRRPIAASSYCGTVGPPALFDRSCVAELLALKDDMGAKRLILADPTRTAEFPFPEAAHDVDTMSDYESVNIIAATSEGTGRFG
jgi:molybdenum cofactor cytidylyltransferase